MSGSARELTPECVERALGRRPSNSQLVANAQLTESHHSSSQFAALKDGADKLRNVSVELPVTGSCRFSPSSLQECIGKRACVRINLDSMVLHQTCSLWNRHLTRLTQRFIAQRWSAQPDMYLLQARYPRREACLELSFKRRDALIAGSAFLLPSLLAASFCSLRPVKRR